MSRSYVGAELRRRVTRRAAGFCEYCLINEEDTFFGCQMEHVVSEKHGGATVAENLALACTPCNRRKGSDIGSIDPDTRRYVRFYHPRVDGWTEHFAFAERWSSIEPRTDVGAVTTRILSLDAAERRLERRALVAAGRYPPPAGLLERFGRRMEESG